MKVCHPDKFTDEQLDVLAVKNSRTASPMFKSCPLCDSEDVAGKMEDHIAGHLLLLALKSLPSYEEPTEEQTQSEGGQCELSSSSARTRSTIEQMPAEHISWHLHDTNDPPQPVHRSDGSSKYKAWGGFRNYISQFPNGITLPHQTHDSSSPTIPYFSSPSGSLDTLISITPFHPSRGLYDPSIDFVEDSLFDNIDKAHHRLFEWGFLPNIHQTYKGPDDPIMAAFALRQHEIRRDKWNVDPDCAVCHSPAPLLCECEAIGLETAMKQAEERMMTSIYRDIRVWAAGHANNLIHKHFEEYLEQPLDPDHSMQEQEQKVERQETSKHHEQAHQEQGHQEKKREEKVHKQGYQEKDHIYLERPEQVQQHSQRDINEAWQAALQGFPKAIEYYFSTIEMTLPADDEVAVRDPPSLRRERPGKPWRKINKD